MVLLRLPVFGLHKKVKGPTPPTTLAVSVTGLEPEGVMPTLVMVLVVVQQAIGTGLLQLVPNVAARRCDWNPPCPAAERKSLCLA